MVADIDRGRETSTVSQCHRVSILHSQQYFSLEQRGLLSGNRDDCGLDNSTAISLIMSAWKLVEAVEEVRQNDPIVTNFGDRRGGRGGRGTKSFGLTSSKRNSCNSLLESFSLLLPTTKSSPV